MTKCRFTESYIPKGKSERASGGKQLKGVERETGGNGVKWGGRNGRGGSHVFFSEPLEKLKLCGPD